MRFVPFMKEVRFWAFMILCGSGLLALVAVTAAMQESPLPVAATAAKVLAFVACFAAIGFALAAACLNDTERGESQWDVEYQAQVANSLVRERRIG